MGDFVSINIAERIRRLREEKGLSTNKLSTDAGLSQSYVRKLENGECNPTVESLSLICDALGTNIVDYQCVAKRAGNFTFSKSPVAGATRGSNQAFNTELSVHMRVRF